MTDTNRPIDYSALTGGASGKGTTGSSSTGYPPHWLIGTGATYNGAALNDPISTAHQNNSNRG